MNVLHFRYGARRELLSAWGRPKHNTSNENDSEYQNQTNIR